MKLGRERLAAGPRGVGRVDNVLVSRSDVDSSTTRREQAIGWQPDQFRTVADGSLWLLSSPGRTLQPLVNGATFDANKPRLLRVRLSHSAQPDPSPELTAHLEEGSAFDATLRELLERTNGHDGDFDWRRALAEAGLLVEGPEV